MTTPSIKPTGHHVLVTPLAWEKETDWGFALTPHENSESAKLEKAGRMYGTLVAVGPQAWKAHAVALLKGLPELVYRRFIDATESWARVGDTIMYSRYAGKSLFDPITGQEYYLIHDEDILAVLPAKDDWEFNPTNKEKVTR